MAHRIERLNMIEFCPRCFKVDKKLSELRKKNEYHKICPWCEHIYIYSATMISEDLVRLYVRETINKSNEMLTELKKLIVKDT